MRVEMHVIAQKRIKNSEHLWFFGKTTNEKWTSKMNKNQVRTNARKTQRISSADLRILTG